MERVEQAKMFSELVLLCEDTVWRTPNLVLAGSSRCAQPRSRSQRNLGLRRFKLGASGLASIRRLAEQMLFCGCALNSYVSYVVLAENTRKPWGVDGRQTP